MAKDIVDKIEPGSTHHSWQFGRQVDESLQHLANNPSEIEPILGSIVYGNLKYIIRESKHAPHDFRLVMFKTKKKPTKNNHCWVVVSDFWAEVMERLKVEFGYKAASNFFLQQFCKFSENMMADYAENFHLHFIAKSKVSNTMTFWKSSLIAEHKGKIEYILHSNCYLQQLDYREYPKIGFVDVLPADIYRSSQYVFKAPASAK